MNKKYLIGIYILNIAIIAFIAMMMYLTDKNIRVGLLVYLIPTILNIAYLIKSKNTKPSAIALIILIAFIAYIVAINVNIGVVTFISLIVFNTAQLMIIIKE